ncbi:MAG: hypothetical protein JXR96_26640 [Deltaproteobacteria bacterium]|nr:hypothetical protein [Deltaproteobacteria bacterium]
MRAIREILHEADKARAAGDRLAAAAGYEEAARLAAEQGGAAQEREYLAQAAGLYAEAGCLHGVPSLLGGASAAPCYAMLAERARAAGDPEGCWRAWLRAAECYAATTVSLYAETADEVYEVMGEMNGHVDSVRRAFEKAIAEAPGEAQRESARRRAVDMLSALAAQYREAAAGLTVQGEDLGESYGAIFEQMARAFASGTEEP